MNVFRSEFVDTTVEVVDPRFNELVLFNAQLENLFDGCRWLEGPVWLSDQQWLLVSDIPTIAFSLGMKAMASVFSCTLLASPTGKQGIVRDGY